MTGVLKYLWINSAKEAGDPFSCSTDAGSLIIRIASGLAGEEQGHEPDRLASHHPPMVRGGLFAVVIPVIEIEHIDRSPIAGALTGT